MPTPLALLALLSASALLFAAGGAAPGTARADAIVRSNAMFASTIAEYFIEDSGVRVELEIGTDDLTAFQNLLPDEIAAKFGLPAVVRLERFFEDDLVISAGDGVPLRGRLLEIDARERVRRDDLTGEPLAPEKGAAAEPVVFVRLRYAFADAPTGARPQRLTLHGPSARDASVGFVAYHGEVPLNDFRYLSARQTAVLDWRDPWYSHFESRSLRRQYAAPMTGFLYIEPYEVRKEIVLRPRDLEHWIELGITDDRIPVDIQPELKRRVAEFLRGHHRVEVDGQAIEPELARVNFLERSLKTSRVVDPPRELDAFSAILGVIFVYPTEGLPQRVTMEWDLWNDRIQRVPASAVDQAGGLPTWLEPDWNVLEWENFLKFPELPTMRALAPPPSPVRRALLWLRWVLGAAALVACARALAARGNPASRSRTVAAAAVALAAVAFAASRGAALSDERAREIVAGVLHNVYRAFDFREEERIYDVLAQSVKGDLLAEIYLETRRGLVLASQGGARAKVKQIELVELEVTPTDDGAFRADAVWHVAGSVGHWGHVHQRVNRYRAVLEIAPADGAWKLVGMEILEEERI